VDAAKKRVTKDLSVGEASWEVALAACNETIEQRTGNAVGQHPKDAKALFLAWKGDLGRTQEAEPQSGVGVKPQGTTARVLAITTFEPVSLALRPGETLFQADDCLGWGLRELFD